MLRLTQALGTSLPQKNSVQTDRLRNKFSTVNPGLQDVALTPKHGGRMTHNPAPVPTTGLGSSSGNFSIGLTGVEKSGKSDDIENPPEMEAMEAGEDNILNECDPETLKEMERRTDEIVEQFMELALDMKSQKRDEAILVYA